MNTTSDDLEDTHLCIKCNGTIVGLEKYIEHRKQNCLDRAEQPSKIMVSPTTTATTTRSSAPAEEVSPSIISRSNLDHSYDGFHFPEPEAPSSYLRKTTASHGGKTSKSLTEAYDLTYELGADVFFSSLQLQSVSTGGKTGTRPERSKEEQNWHASSSCSDPLLKAVRDHDESDFKRLKFVHSPEPSDEEEDDEEPDDFDEDDAEHDHDPDEDYDARRHSPPTVPASHTGGKWKPEHRPQLRHTHMERISPSWDEPPDEPHDHPPAEHTHGKWVPGSKQLEYRDNIDLTKLQQPGASFWCNICCRRLKTRLNYEQHLRSGYHQRRADAECQLEQANLNVANLTLTKDFQPPPTELAQLRTRRRRRCNLLRCELCRHSMARHLIGKHLISHYHYRRLQQQQTQARKQESLHIILEHMGSIVRQAPFQCLPCRFYANTEQGFQSHWRSSAHVKHTERMGGHFWCGYCQFECASNDEMWQHLLHATHKEVLFALNRSVPVCISQRRYLSCPKCTERFLYNVQLRRHFATAHVDLLVTGSASDEYQCRFRCAVCGSPQRSRVALQRHEKLKHRLARYYCAVCRLEFETPQEARRHRSHMQHKQRASRQTRRKSSAQPERDIEQMLREVLEEQQPEQHSEQPVEEQSQRSAPNVKRLPNQCASCSLSFETPQTLAQHRREAHGMDNHVCLSCGGSFQSAQALGRHTRSCQPIASSSAAVASAQSKSFNCDQCSFTAQYESDLLYHRFFHTRNSTIGKNELLQCPLCPKQFRKHSLRAHLRNHTGERIFECGECLAKFARRHNLKNHMTTMHGERSKTVAVVKQAEKKTPKDTPKQKYQCGSCGKILAKKYSLKLHEMSHADVKRQFPCHFKDCQYAGLTPEALKIHLASHAEGSHKCEHPSCNYVGKSKMHLKRHSKSHLTEQEQSEGSKWFSCDQCEFKARIRGHLKRHMRRHTGEKPHQCPHCDFQCSSFDNLRKHIVKTGKHPGKFIYECEKCAEQQTSNIFKSNSFKEYQIHLATHKK